MEDSFPWFQISTHSHISNRCEGRWLRRLAEMYTSALELFEAALYISPSTTSGTFQQACCLERIQLNLFWIHLKYYFLDPKFPIVLSFSEMKTSSRPNLQKRRWCLLSCGSENIKKWFWKNLLKTSSCHCGEGGDMFFPPNLTDITATDLFLKRTSPFQCTCWKQ